MQAQALVAMIASSLVASAALSSDTPSVRQIGAARLENVPPIPAEVTAAVQRYQSYRAATFHGCLADGSILIATRFGATQQIHRVTEPGAARTQLTFSNEPAARAFVVPRTQRFLVSRDRGGDEWFQLHLADAKGESAAFTEAGTRNESPVFSPDGALVAWSRAVKGSSDYSILLADLDEIDSPRSVYSEDGAIEPADISADKKLLAFTRNYSNRESRLHVLDLATGKARELAGAADVLYQDPQFAADGRSVFAISNHDSDVRRLVQIDLTSGALAVLTPDVQWDVERFSLSSDGRILAYALNEEGYSRIVVQDVRTRRALPQPELPGGVISRMEFCAGSSRLAFDLSTATSAGDAWSWHVERSALERWTVSELGGLDPAQLSEPELVRFESFDGLKVSAFVYRPAGVDAKTRTPVIIDIHGGPESQTRPGWNVGAQYFAGVLGATVILPNVRGSAGYGLRYMNLDNAERREDSVRDIGALLDWIERQPGLDARRVAVYGQSYGGYMSLAVMTHYASRLVGGVERYGISDFISFLSNTEAYRRDNRRAEYGDERDPAMRAVFERISPLNNVAKIVKPMLVMQGANDPRVPQSESDQVVAGIRRNGAEVWYVVFADEGHGFHKKPNADLRREVETVFLGRLFSS